MTSAIRFYTRTGVSPDWLTEQLAAGDWRWAYAERQDDIILCWLSHLPGGVNHWDHGRAFALQSELAWWRQPDGSLQLRLLAETPPASGHGWQDGGVWQPYGPVQQTVLHGLRDDAPPDPETPAWSEQRIPRWLHYPVPLDSRGAPLRVVLLVQPYAQNELVGLTRLLALDGYWPPQEFS